MRVTHAVRGYGSLPGSYNQEYRIESLSGLYADGADITGGWPDVSGNGLHLADSGAGNRPSYRSNPLGDNVPAARFDAVSEFLQVTGMVSPANSDLTIYSVVTTGHAGVAIGGTVPWSLGRAGVLSNAVGCARGIIGAASLTWGGQANNLGGAVAYGPGFSAQDGLAEGNSGGIFIRRAFCHRWSTRVGNWILSSFVGDTGVIHSYGGAPPANNFSYTALVLGAEYNGGGGKLNFFGGEYSYFARSTTAHTDEQVKNKLRQLRDTYLCL